MTINGRYSINNSKRIEDLINNLEEYKSELVEKAQMFVSRLMDIGIETAEANTGQYRGFIVFKRHMIADKDSADGVIVATDGTKLVREWYRDGRIVSTEISPLLMAEFGSGWLAKVLDDVSGVGQGTFPGQRHAFDKDGWDWTTPDGETHHSIGETPTFPMHSAALAMEFEINRVGREVFGNV